MSRTALTRTARRSMPSASALASERATSSGPGKSGLRAMLDAAAHTATRIAAVSAVRAAPRIVRLLSRDLLDLGPDLVRDLLDETGRAQIPRASRAREIDGNVADDAAGPRSDEHDAVAEAHRFFDLMGDEEHRRARRSNDALDL